MKHTYDEWAIPPVFKKAFCHMRDVLEQDFFFRVAQNEPYGSVDRITSRFGRPLEELVGKKQQFLLRVARTYWTLRTELEDLRPDEDFCTPVRILRGLTDTFRNYIFGFSPTRQSPDYGEYRWHAFSWLEEGFSRFTPRFPPKLEEALWNIGDPHRVLKDDQLHSVIMEAEGAFRSEEFSIQVEGCGKKAVFGLLYEHQWSKGASPGAPLEYRCVPLGALLSRADTPEFEEAQSYIEEDIDGTATGTEVFAERLFRHLKAKPGLSLDDRHLAHEFFSPPMSLMASPGAVEVTMIRIGQLPPVEVKSVHLGGFRELRKTLLTILLCGHVLRDSDSFATESVSNLNALNARLQGTDPAAPWRWEELWSKTAHLLLDSFIDDMLRKDLLRRCQHIHCRFGPYFLPTRDSKIYCSQSCRVNAGKRRYYVRRKQGRRPCRGASV
jgi:hypothetical protein